MATFSEDDFADAGPKTFSEEDFASEAPKPSVMDSVLSAGGQGFTGGFQDEITGGIQALPALLSGDTEQAGKDYRQYRDAMRGEAARAKEAHPVVAGVTEFATGLPMGLATGSLAGNAVLGAAQGLGHSQEDTIGGDLANAAIGGGTALAIGGLAPYVGKGISKLGGKLDDISAYLANKRIPGGKGLERGRYIRDELGAMGSLDSMAAKNAQNIEEAVPQWELPDLPSKPMVGTNTVAGKGQAAATPESFEQYMPKRVTAPQDQMMQSLQGDIQKAPRVDLGEVAGDAMLGGAMGGGAGAVMGAARKVAKPIVAGGGSVFLGGVGKAMSKYSKELEDAFQRGGQRLVTTTEYLLNLRDPELRELKRAENED